MFAVLIAWAIFTAFPLYWTAVTSVKSPADTASGKPTFVPWVDFDPSLQPYRDIFGAGEGFEVQGMGDIGHLARNSLIAALGSGGLAILLGTTTAYALSRFRFQRWKNKDIAFWIISQRMFPPIALVV